MWGTCKRKILTKTFNRQSVRPLSCHCCWGLVSSWAPRCWISWVRLSSLAWTGWVRPPQWQWAPWGAVPQRHQWSILVCRRCCLSGWAHEGRSLWWRSPSPGSSSAGCCGPAQCGGCWCRGCYSLQSPLLRLAHRWLIFWCDVEPLEADQCAGSWHGTPGFSCLCHGWRCPENGQCRWCECTTLSLQTPGQNNSYFLNTDTCKSFNTAFISAPLNPQGFSDKRKTWNIKY